MIKIAYVINFIRNGGPSNVIRSIIKKLDRNEYDITLVTFFSEENDPMVVAELCGMGIHIIELRFASRMKCMLFGSGEIQSLMLKNQIDIIHSHGFLPDVISSRLHINVKKISTIHSNIFEDYSEVYGSRRSKIYTRIHLHCLKKIHNQVCCSKSVYEALKSFLTNGTYIRNGIDRTCIHEKLTREALGFKDDDILYIYVGHLRKLKNITSLLQKFKLFHEKNEHLLVLGRGDEEEKCRKIVDENIHMIGFTTNAIAYLDIADIYVSASLSEGFSIAVLEALDNGLLLLLSDIPSHQEVFMIDSEYYLGEYFDDQHFEEKMLTVRKQAQIHKKEDTKLFKDKYLSAEIMAKRYMDLYIG